ISHSSCSSRPCPPLLLPSFPTRRSSDLAKQVFGEVQPCVGKPQCARHAIAVDERARSLLPLHPAELPDQVPESAALRDRPGMQRSEEHTSELQSLRHLVCRLLLEKKKHN